jgi:hypothetical protein
VCLDLAVAVPPAATEQNAPKLPPQPPLLQTSNLTFIARALTPHPQRHFSAGNKRPQTLLRKSSERNADSVPKVEEEGGGKTQAPHRTDLRNHAFF